MRNNMSEVKSFDETVVRATESLQIQRNDDKSEKEVNQLLKDYRHENLVLRETVVRLQKELKETLTHQLEAKEVEEKFIQDVEKRYRTYKLEQEENQEKLKKKHDQLLQRYNALKRSKLGHLTLKYWDFRKKLRTRVSK
ncbi:hypothetical protein [Ornithinibacillus halophilus]|nr:hypothetical protein [Ornithinibacillus halophilus]